MKHGLFNLMKKITSLVITGVLAAATVVAAPVAAQAAPKSFDLPKNCSSIYGGKKLTAKEAQAKQGNVHPNKGKEYVYSVHCFNEDYTTTNHLVVANSKGKLLSSSVIGKDVFSGVLSVSKKGVVELGTLLQYKGNTSEYRTMTATWNKKSKKLKINKGKTAGYVKAVHNLGSQLAKGKKATAVTGSKANLKKINNFGKKYKKAKANVRAISCAEITSKKGACSLTYLKGSKVYGLTFEVSKSGKKYKVSKLKTTSVKAGQG